MKKLLTTLAAATMLMTGAAFAEIKLGLDVAPYPPFADQDASGKRMGFEIELGEAICKAMNETCVWTPIAWDGIIPALQSNKIDAIFASMSITPKRMEVIDFSNKYYNTPAAVVAAKDMDIDGSAESLKGKIVGVQVSTTHADYANKVFSESSEVKTYSAFDEHNNDLIAGRVDAVVGDSLAFSEFLKTEAGMKFEIKATPTDEAVFGKGVGVGVRKGDAELLKKFNDAIAKVRADGTYDEIAKKYFEFNIYGQ
ncbi:transporter substrate-binding domain-containing protein [Pseudahrensia aquimaris]|uniref:Transporter substrate-binding domain-containing protein n=1 Tax=Pseudahrensia aquimaris TaxID=744461 RepID=A0ABW3FE20_9HYPH